jgi:hypothetical protein
LKSVMKEGRMIDLARLPEKRVLSSNGTQAAERP